MTKKDLLNKYSESNFGGTYTAYLEYLLCNINFPFNCKKYIDANFIIEHVASAYKCTVEDMCLNSRKNESLEPRQVAHYLLKNLTKLSFKQIGLKVGNKDYATAMHSCKTVENYIQTDALYRNNISLIIDKITG